MVNQALKLADAQTQDVNRQQPPGKIVTIGSYGSGNGSGLAKRGLTPNTGSMKVFRLQAEDTVFAANLLQAGLAAGLAIQAGTSDRYNETDSVALLLVQTGTQLQVPAATGGAGETLPLPARLGAIVDWLQRLARRVPALVFPDGVTQLEPQARRILLRDAAGAETVLPLTEKEVDMLAYLAGQRRAVPRAELLQAVWGYNPEADTHTLETHIYRLRQKLDGAGLPALLQTGEEGYRFAD